MALSVSAYNTVSKDVMCRVYTMLDALTGDATMKDGVVTYKAEDKGVYVVNRQPPRQEIWLSSPVSGPYHFAYKNSKWIDKKNNELFALMAKELGIQRAMDEIE